MNYRREIDGLRALAVLPVILFHAGFETFSGGFVGVDVFFVISGYLITSIILGELEQGKFSIVNFYERRARRILPALFLVMLACLPFAMMFLLPNQMRDFARSLVAVPLFVSNLLFWKESGYFDTAAELKPLLHTWSLAVEEQYYVLFPLFLMLCWRFGRRWLFILLTGAFFGSLALAEWGSIAKPTATFFILPTRGWELLVGAFAAIYLSRANAPKFSRNVGEVGGWLGVALILFAVFVYNQTTPFPGLYALVPTVGAVLIILFATQDTSAGKFVGNKAFVGIGLISFSAYLWHQPLFAFARHRSISEPGPVDFAVLIVLSLVLAYFSWRFVEGPFRNKAVFSRARIFTFSAVGSLLFIGIGLLGHFNYDKIIDVWVQRYPEQHRAFYKSLFSEDPALDTFGASRNGAQHLSDCRFNVSNINAATEKTFQECHAKYGPGVLIFGDSHSVDLYGAVASKFPERFLVGITSPGCRPHTPRPDCPYERIASFAKNNREVFSHVIFEQAGAYLLLDPEKRKGVRRMFERIPYGAPVEGFTFDEEHIQRTVDYLVDFSSAVPVTWFLPRLEPHIDRRLLFRNGCEYNWTLRPGMDKLFHSLDERIVKAVKDRHAEHVKTVSQNDVFAFSFPSDFLTCHDVYWSDGDHLSGSGEQRFGQRLPDNFLKY